MTTYTTTIQGANNSAVFTATYAYDADGARVMKRSSTDDTFYVGDYLEKDMTHNVRTTYYYFGAQRVAMRKGSEVYWLHGDHLGSTSVIVSQDGTVQATDYYYPFGANRGGSAFSELTAKQFTGQYGASGLAGSEGLSYYGARWYDASLGRFVSADSLIPSPKQPQSLNRFSYSNNSPTNMTDPSGHAPSCSAIALPGCPGYSDRQPIYQIQYGMGYVSARKPIIQENLPTFQSRRQYLLSSDDRYGYNACGLVASGPPIGQGDWTAYAAKYRESAGATYGAKTGIQPSHLTGAVGDVLGEGQVTSYNQWSLEELNDSLLDGKLVVVDIQVGSLRQADENLREFPTPMTPNYAHFVRVLGIDMTNDKIYLENTLQQHPGEIWEMSLGEFNRVWEYPEVGVGSGNNYPTYGEYVTRWALVINPAAFLK